jgi:hypothetical protein
MTDLRIFWIVLLRDPYLFVGLLFIGVPTVAYWFMYKKLIEAGFKSKSRITLPALWWEALIREYARTRAKFGWPTWPLHATWLGLLIGIPLVVIGVFKL